MSLTLYQEERLERKEKVETAQCLNLCAKHAQKQPHANIISNLCRLIECLPVLYASSPLCIACTSPSTCTPSVLHAAHPINHLSRQPVHVCRVSHLLSHAPRHTPAHHLCCLQLIPSICSSQPVHVKCVSHAAHHQPVHRRADWCNLGHSQLFCAAFRRQGGFFLMLLDTCLLLCPPLALVTATNAIL